LNSVLTKILKMKASFFRIFISKFLKILKISNPTCWFSVNRQNWWSSFVGFSIVTIVM
jgi:hypothetical protein